MGPLPDGKTHDTERQLRQGDLPVQPNRPLEPPADGTTMLPGQWDNPESEVAADIQDAFEPDPVREAVIADDWPAR